MSETDDLQGLEVGPHPVEGLSVFYRGITGALGGAGGALVLLLGVLLGGTVLGSIFTTDSGSLGSPIAMFFGLAIMFLAATVSNGLGAFLIGLTDAQKFVNSGKALVQIILVNIVIFIFVLPVYLIAKSIDTNLVGFVVALHLLFSAMTSALVFNILATERSQVLLNIYSVILSVFVAILLLILVYLMAKENSQLVLLFLMPVIIWFSIGFIGGIIEYFYYQFYRKSGVDVLRSESPSDFDTTVNDEDFENK